MMKRLLTIIGFMLAAMVGQAQFTGPDSLRNFNNRFIDNNASKAFTNLRLHNLLGGIIDLIEATAGGSSVSLGIDTLYVTQDSIFHYRKGGVFRQFIVRGRPGARNIYEVPFSDGAGRFAADSNFKFDKSQGDNNTRLIVGPVAVTDGGLAKVNIISDNMNAAALNAYGTGVNTIVFRRALGTIGTPLALTNESDLWNFSGRGYTGTAFSTTRATIYARTTQDWTDTTQGTKLVFKTTENDSAKAYERLVIDHDGSLYADSITNLRIKGTRLDPSYPNNRHAFTLERKHGFLYNPSFTLKDAIRNVGNSYDSAGFAIESSPYQLLFKHFGNSASIANVVLAGNTPFPAVSIQSSNGVKTSYITVGNQLVISGADSTLIKLPIGTSDTAIGLVNLGFGLRKMVAVPMSGGSTGSAGGDLTGTYPNPTIGTNAVSNAKFRQSAGNAVIGRASNSTGNVADITPGSPNTVLLYDGTTTKFDALDYAHLINKPDLQNPGIYFSPAQSFDPTFVVWSGCIPYPTSTFSHGTDITYGILDNTTAHNSSFYDSVYGNSGNARIVVRFPAVRMVLNSKILCDETLSSYGLHMGPTVGTSTFEAPAYQTRTAGIRLTGDGSGGWTKNTSFGTNSGWDVTSYNTGDGSTSFNTVSPTIIATGYDEVGIQYIGANNYGIKRVYSGLGSYNAKFVLVDRATGLFVSTNPTTSDEILITNAGNQERQINLSIYQAGNNEFLDGSFVNFWVDGYFECWLVAAPTSTTSTLVRWQTNYPSATSYKIYRSTSLYGARTLLYSGTAGSLTDTGLTTGTLYFYHMVAVVGGVDTYVTYFKTNTK